MVDIVAATGTTVTVPDEAINVVAALTTVTRGRNRMSVAILVLVLSKARRTLPISLADSR